MTSWLAAVAVLGCNADKPGELDDDSTLDSVLVGEQTKLTSADAEAGDRFGSILAVSGDTAILGAPGDRTALVIERTADGWVETGRLSSSEIGDDDAFGYNVAIDGDTALVAGWYGETQTGSAHVFVRDASGWSEQGVLRAGDGEPNDSFAASLALSGDVAVVGAPGDTGSSGSAYVFERADREWTETIRLFAPDEADQVEKFGSSVAVEGDLIVAGAPEDYFFGRFSGSAYVFERGEDGWAVDAQLFGQDFDHHDQFGASVALSQGTILVGAYGDDEYTGSAYVFTRGPGEGDSEGQIVWGQQAKLVASDAKEKERFGLGVAIAGDLAVIGADLSDPIHNISDEDTGAVYVFMRTGSEWTQDSKQVSRDGQPGDHFGYPIALSGTTVVVGASPEEFRQPLVGFAYAFDVARDTDDDGVADVIDNCAELANADQDDLDGDGLGDLCDPDDDNDGNVDENDNCREQPNADQKNSDGDTLGDACDDDDDGDGVADVDDNCVLTANAAQTDADENGVGDACEDLDGDGVSALDDNCPDHPNATQEDEDGNGVGDACDDLDGDGVSGITDNCPDDDNPGQEDLDGDGMGDACDSDFDGDGVLNADDNCPRTANADQADVCQTPYGCAAVSASPSAPLWILGLLAIGLRRRRRVRHMR